jgi:hypothetical protein
LGDDHRAPLLNDDESKMSGKGATAPKLCIRFLEGLVSFARRTDATESRDTRDRKPLRASDSRKFSPDSSQFKAAVVKMLERELNGAESDQTVPAASFRRISFDDRSEEFQWLAQNSGRFQGEWVALSGKRLLAHNVDYNKVSQDVKSLGIDGAMLMFVEGEGNEDFVRFLP